MYMAVPASRPRHNLPLVGPPQSITFRMEALQSGKRSSCEKPATVIVHRIGKLRVRRHLPTPYADFIKAILWGKNTVCGLQMLSLFIP